jgi:hypothetical protein
MGTLFLRDSLYSHTQNEEHNVITHSIALSNDEVDRLSELVAVYPGVSMHLAHLAVFRAGLQLVGAEPALLAAELASIGESRRERRRQARNAKKDSHAAEGGSNG